MPVPTYDTLMLPVLGLCADREWLMRELVAQISVNLSLTEEEQQQRIPSGMTTVIANRVHWAKTYLKQAGLLEQPRRAYVQITPRGREVLANRPTRIDPEFLQQFEEFRNFQSRTKADTPATIVEISPSSSLFVEPSTTPEEQIAIASRAHEESLRDALLARILEGTPSFFEQLIVDLLLAMGYGGSRADAGEKIGGTSDGGVDGVIREDQLGLDRVYLQAKRYQPGNNVPPGIVQAFIGALVGRGAHKGVLITTSKFTQAAITAAQQSGTLRVVLIDGEELTKLMVRFNVGVRVARSVELKRIDADYFGDDESE